MHSSYNTYYSIKSKLQAFSCYKEKIIFLVQKISDIILSTSTMEYAILSDLTLYIQPYF